MTGWLNADEPQQAQALPLPYQPCPCRLGALLRSFCSCDTLGFFEISFIYFISRTSKHQCGFLGLPHLQTSVCGRAPSLGMFSVQTCSLAGHVSCSALRRLCIWWRQIYILDWTAVPYNHQATCYLHLYDQQAPHACHVPKEIVYPTFPCPILKGSSVVLISVNNNSHLSDQKLSSHFFSFSCTHILFNSKSGL